MTDGKWKPEGGFKPGIGIGGRTVGFIFILASFGVILTTSSMDDDRMRLQGCVTYQEIQERVFIEELKPADTEARLLGWKLLKVSCLEILDNENQG